MISGDVLIRAESVSKKYCRALKRSMLYSLQDVFGDLFNLKITTKLRTNEFWALKDVSFEVKRGECIGVIGANGAGKSTLLKLLNGLVLPDSGKITLCGRVGALIELGAGFHPMLTGRENIYVNGAILGLKKQDINQKFDEIVNFAGLEDFIDSPVKYFSSGMYVRLGFSIAAHLNPEILLIDEVLAVGDVAFRLKCFNHIRSLVENGTTVILVSHNLADVLRICSRGLVFQKGRLIDSDSLAESILLYQNTMQESTNNDHKSPESPVRLKSVKTLNSFRKPNQDFRSGDDVLVEIQYESRISATDSVFIIKLASPELGEFLSFTNRVTDTQLPIIKGVGRVVVRLQELPLMAGNYAVQVHLYDADAKCFWDQAVPACTFNIVEPLPEVWREFHMLRVKHDWLS